jgi:hypothetical protein
VQPIGNRQFALKSRSMPDPAVPLSEDFRWIVTTAIALWGAILATYQQVLLWTTRNPRLSVALQLGEIADAPIHVLGQPQKTVAAMAVNVTNRGRVNVRLEYDCCEIEVKGGKNRIGVQPDYCEPENLPATISAGNNLRINIRAKELFETIRQQFGYPAKMRIHIKDAIGRTYRSKWIEVP